ncbi:MAG TPA: hypothetical protein VNO50_15080 [Pyrinomonadaceae bacterium]|nr:hypothetical protein [Pyrinomonadaceae bacterium]
MTNGIQMSNSKRPALAALIFLALIATSFAAPGLGNLSRRPSVTLDQPVRVTLVRKNFADASTDAKELDLEFTGVNGTVSRLQATNGKQTYSFERSEEAALICPRGSVKECDSLILKGGGKLSACACVKLEPATQTKEHILLARQVGVPSMMTESTREERIAPRSERGYEVALIDKTPLRATSGRQTCWLNKKLRVSVCY